MHVLDLRVGTHQRIARLSEDLEILGAPQWTKRGICYVAGKEEVSGDESVTPLYDLDLEAEDLEDVMSNEDMEIKTGPDDLAWSPDGESVAIIARGAISEQPSVHAGSADTLLEEFYNLYEVPVEGTARAKR